MVAAVADVAEFNPVGGCLEFYGATDPEVLAVGPAGTGKAQPLDATVYTVDGPKHMGDIAIGDVVVTPDGATAPVTGIFPQGEQDVYRLTFTGGDVVECTSDHLWDVRYMGGGKRNGNKVREMRTVATVSELMRDHLVGSRRRPKYWVPQPAPAAFSERPVTIPAYTLGFLIGDGHIRSGMISFATGDSEIASRLQAELGHDYVVRHKGRADYAIVGASSAVSMSRLGSEIRSFVSWHKASGKWAVNARPPGGKQKHIGLYVEKQDAEAAAATYSREANRSYAPTAPSLWTKARELGLTGKLSADKFVPNRYKYNSVAIRRDMLRGLMDADGTVDRKTGMPSFCTVSRRLAEDVKWLVESLGGICTITEKHPVNGQTAYQCWIRYNDPAELFTLKRKRERCKERTKYPVKRMLLSIERTGRKTCQCIRVDHPDHLYLTNHFVVTHNTLAACWKLHDVAMGVPGVRILMARKVLEDLKTGALATYTNHVKPELDGVITFGGNRFYPGEFRYPNGSVIHVVGMDKPGKVMSAEYDIIFVNEATEISEQVWQALKSRLRNGVLGYQQLMADCNPSGPRHWLNVRCNTGATRRIVTTHKDNPAYWDAERGEWTAMGRMYVQNTLGSLTGVERKRLFEGVWASAEGLVYPEFNHELHVKDVDVTGWRTVMGVDVGSRNPTAIITAHIAGDGRVHISRELYRRNMTSSDILSAIETEADATNPDTIYIDPSAKGYIEDLWRDGYPAEAAVNDILVGIQRVHSVFQTGFTIAPDCTSTIDEFGMYCYPDNPRIETDKPKQENDHAMDAIRYLCMGAADPVLDLKEFFSW